MAKNRNTKYFPHGGLQAIDENDPIRFQVDKIRQFVQK